jgi:hypothetical protein
MLKKVLIVVAAVVILAWVITLFRVLVPLLG